MDQRMLHDRLKPEAAKIDEAMHNDIRIIGDDLLREVLEHSLFNGGKRVRPLLCVFAAKLCGATDQALYNLAIAFEYLHVASLLHDDVIDHADKRRNRQTVNTLWGSTPAILAGDWLHARSMFLIGNLGGKHCLEIISRATAAMVEGEFLQLRNTGNSALSVEDYFKIIAGKTALLIAAVCEIGAVFGKATIKEQQALNSYGTALGQAFQVVDDMLDYLGDPALTGKAVGTDFIEGKLTLPLIHALGKAAPPERELICSLLTGHESGRLEHFASVRQLIEKYDGFGYAKQQARMFVNSAIAGLDIFAAVPTAETRSLLIGIADYVLTREK
jgi:octaprenyl-diphosphate synthase